MILLFNSKINELNYSKYVLGTVLLKERNWP